MKQLGNPRLAAKRLKRFERRHFAQPGSAEYGWHLCGAWWDYLATRLTTAKRRTGTWQWFNRWVARIYRVRPAVGASGCLDTYLAVAYDCHGAGEYAPRFRECMTLFDAMDYCENDLRASGIIPRD